MTIATRIHDWCINHTEQCEFIVGSLLLIPPFYIGVYHYVSQQMQNVARQKELQEQMLKDRRIVWQNLAKSEFPDQHLFIDQTDPTVDRNDRALSASSLTKDCFYEKIELTNFPEHSYTREVTDEMPRSDSDPKTSITSRNSQNEIALSDTASCIFERIVNPFKDRLIQCSGKMKGGSRFLVRELIVSDSFKHPLCHELCGLREQDSPQSISLRK